MITIPRKRLIQRRLSTADAALEGRGRPFLGASRRQEMSSVRKSHKIVATSALVLAAITVSACGSSSSGGTPQSSASSTPTASSNSTSGVVAAAQALVTKYEQPVTK